MVCVPSVGFGSVTVTCPVAPTVLRLTVPRVVLPSITITVPVGTPGPGTTSLPTWTVMVADSPTVKELLPDTPMETGRTPCREKFSATDVAGPKLFEPPKKAVTL